MAERALDRLKAEDFQALVGAPFQLRAGPGPLDTVLAEVSVHHSPGLEGFSLLFQGPPEPVLPQGTYRVASPGFGECDLFLVPVRAGTTYQAVFSRLAAPPLPERRS